MAYLPSTIILAIKPMKKTSATDASINPVLMLAFFCSGVMIQEMLSAAISQ
jgi:hypothetical protein